jgi:hypothetical protein
MMRTRLMLDLAPGLNAHVERLAAARGVSKAGLFRQVISLLEAADTAQKEGLQVGAWKQDGTVLREQVFVL